MPMQNNHVFVEIMSQNAEPGGGSNKSLCGHFLEMGWKQTLV